MLVSHGANQLDDVSPNLRILDLLKRPVKLDAFPGIQKFRIICLRAVFRESRRVLGAVIKWQLHKKELDLYAKNLGKIPQSAGADTVDPFFVFLNLLKSQPQKIAEFLLAHAEKYSLQPHTAANVNIDGIGLLRAVFAGRNLGPASVIAH